MAIGFENGGVFIVSPDILGPTMGQYALWSLWSRNRKGIRQGIYSHHTAPSLFDLSDLMPEKLHITVPKSFRRHSKIPGVLVIHRGIIKPNEIEEREGYGVTRPVRTLVDLIMEDSVSSEIIQQAFQEAKKRDLTKGETEGYVGFKARR